MLLPQNPGSRFQRQGAVTVWLIASLGVIIAIVALGLDGGRTLDERRRAQAAADAAALAAAVDLYDSYKANQGSDPGGTARKAALASAASNGFSNDGSTSTVTVNIPPKSGSFAGQASHVEVIIQGNVTGSFSAALHHDTLSAQARSVARGQPRKLGLLLLQASGANAFQATGLTSLTVLGAPVIVNSSDAQAFSDSSLGIMLAPSYQITGNYAKTGLGLMLGKVQTGVPPTPDPLRYLPAPDLASCVVRANSATSVGGIALLQPGIYRGGLSINGIGTIAVLQPGVYIMDGGGFQVSVGAVVLAPGVMIYNTGTNPGNITISGGVLTLTPPTSGTYTGISVFQDRAVSLPLQLSWVGASVATGVFYAPAAQVQLSGVSVSLNILSPAYIAASLRLSGAGLFTVAQGGTLAPIPEVYLVE